MEFITTDGKLIVDSKSIYQKRLSKTHRINLLLYTFFFLFVVNLFVEKIEMVQESGKTSRWISVIVLGMILLLYATALFDYFFRRSQKKKIDIVNIDKVRIYQSDEGLETNVELILINKRYKIYKFRTLEKQFNSFIETLLSINPNTKLISI